MLKLIYRSTLRSLLATLFLGLLLCAVYPLLITGIAHLFFEKSARGGLLTDAQGHVIGAQLIGQSFTRPEYFHGRPSAAGTGYDAANSSGSNLGPTNQKFVDGLQTNIDTVLKENPTLKKGEIPVDLVTASGSGLDPHLSPEAALVQIARIAQARSMSPDELRTLVATQTEGPTWGIFGEAVVNVLAINLALDRQHPRHR